MAGAGFIIIFVVAFVGCAIWSGIFLTFAAHYFLTTIIDSSSGQDEVHFPKEGVIEWWWKPLFCAWIFGGWVVPVLMVLAPFLARQPAALGICLAAALWVLYPIGILSGLYTQNWLFFLHPGIAWRMVRHYGAFAYVQLITLISVGVCGIVLFKVFTSTFLWALPAAFLVPTTLLFYARNWGRFAWLSLNFLPRAKKNRFAEKKFAEDDVPVMDVEAADPHAEAIREGMPTSSGHAYQSGVPTKGSPHIRAGVTPWAAQESEEDEWATDKKSYAVDDAGQPTLAEQWSASAPQPAASLPAKPPPPLEVEEDEWAPVKKPYLVDDPTHPPAPDPTLHAKPEADRPVVLTNYYEDRARKEKAEARRKAEASRSMPRLSKKTPTFRTALFFGVWEFMIYGRTLSVWTNLVALTIVELFFLLMVVQFWPKAD